LDASFSSADLLGGTVFLRYPTGWAAQADESGLTIQLVNRPDLLNNTSLSAGVVRVVVNVAPLAIAGANLPADTPLTARSFLASFLTPLSQSNPQTVISAVADTTIGGKPAAQVLLSTTDGAVWLVAIAKDEAYILLSGTTLPNEQTQFVPVIEAIAASVDYSQAAE
jgi:hypothetical protein